MPQKAQRTDAQKQLKAMVADWPEAQEEYERLGPRYAAIGELIRARRAERLSQAELAKRMGVSAAVVSRLESGTHSPRLDTLAQAARAMGQELELRFVRAKSPKRAADARKPNTAARSTRRSTSTARKAS